MCLPISPGRFPRPMAIFKPPQLGPDFSNQHRRNPVLFLTAANPVSHTNALSGCKDFTYNHAKRISSSKDHSDNLQTNQSLSKAVILQGLLIIFKWDPECSLSVFLIQADIDCGTHLCTGWCFCPGLPLLTLFFHTCEGQREQQDQLKWKQVYCMKLSFRLSILYILNTHYRTIFSHFLHNLTK